jgi:hypothetical protein
MIIERLSATPTGYSLDGAARYASSVTISIQMTTDERSSTALYGILVVGCAESLLIAAGGACLWSEPRVC